MVKFNFCKINSLKLTSILVLLEQYEIAYNPQHFRLRCNGHIINLTAQAFLFHSDKESLAIKNNSSLLTSPTTTEMDY